MGHGLAGSSSSSISLLLRFFFPFLGPDVVVCSCVVQGVVASREERVALEVASNWSAADCDRGGEGV